MILSFKKIFSLSYSDPIPYFPITCSFLFWIFNFWFVVFIHICDCFCNYTQFITGLLFHFLFSFILCFSVLSCSKVLSVNFFSHNFARILSYFAWLFVLCFLGPEIISNPIASKKGFGGLLCFLVQDYLLLLITDSSLNKFCFKKCYF